MAKPKLEGLPLIEPPSCHTPFKRSMFDDPNFLAELKLDGGRYMAYNEPKIIRLISRGRNIDRIDNFEHLSEFIARKINPFTIFDGEIVLGNFSGTVRVLNSSPEHAAEVQKKHGLAKYYVFDIPYYNGQDLRMQPLKYRKAVLATVLKKAPDFIQPVPYTIKDKLEFYYAYVRQGGEGVILKDTRLAYGFDWCKVKHRFDVSVIIKQVHQDRSAVDMGVYQDGQLVHVGDCSTNKHALRSELLQHSNMFIGRVLDISCQNFQGDSLRSPTWVKIREDLDPATITMEKLKRDMELGLRAEMK